VPGALPSNSSEERVEIQYLNLPSVVSLKESEQLVISIEIPKRSIKEEWILLIFMALYIFNSLKYKI